MDVHEISFENLPKAVAHLASELAEIKSLVEKGQTPIVPQKRIPIDIEEACRIMVRRNLLCMHLYANDYFPVTRTVKKSISLKMSYWRGLKVGGKRP